MAAAQLSGARVMAKGNLASLRGLRLSPTRSRVSSSNWVELDRQCFRSLVPSVLAVRNPKLSISMCLNGSSTRTPDVETSTAIKHSEDQQEKLSNEPVKSLSTEDLGDGNSGVDIHVGSVSHKRSAKIHDFCLGIPFGGFVFGGGLLGFLFSRNSSSLTTGVLFGGVILALGVFSLKVWRKGRSSLPFILGQAAIAAALLRKHFQSYSLTKKIFPSGFYIFISAAMICFYSYVLIAGGNPPPKKLASAPPSQL